MCPQKEQNPTKATFSMKFKVKATRSSCLKVPFKVQLEEGFEWSNPYGLSVMYNVENLDLETGNVQDQE